MNEAELPAVLWELPDEREPGWRCRAVPNRYAAFREEDEEGAVRASVDPSPALREGSGPGVEPGRRHPARGLQEVLIESPRHDRDPATMNALELEALVELYVQRIARLVRERPDLTPVLFRNQGAGAGATLRHPHAQLVATRDILPYTWVREDRQRRYHRDEGHCLLCRLPGSEPDHEARIVTEDPHFRVEIPWAPERPLETWIVPRRHRASVHAVDPDEQEAFGQLLGTLLRALRIVAGKVDYNYILHSTAGARTSDPALHWLLQLRPVTARTAGFELGSGALIAPSDPIEDAARLRRAVDDLPEKGVIA